MWLQRSFCKVMLHFRTQMISMTGLCEDQIPFLWRERLLFFVRRDLQDSKQKTYTWYLLVALFYHSQTETSCPSSSSQLTTNISKMLGWSSLEGATRILKFIGDSYRHIILKRYLNMWLYIYIDWCNAFPYEIYIYNYNIFFYFYIVSPYSFDLTSRLFPFKKGAIAAKKMRQGSCDERNGRNFGGIRCKVDRLYHQNAMGTHVKPSFLGLIITLITHILRA